MCSDAIFLRIQCAFVAKSASISKWYDSGSCDLCTTPVKAAVGQLYAVLCLQTKAES